MFKRKQPTIRNPPRKSLKQANLRRPYQKVKRTAKARAVDNFRHLTLLSLQTQVKMIKAKKILKLKIGLVPSQREHKAAESAASLEGVLPTFKLQKMPMKKNSIWTKAIRKDHLKKVQMRIQITIYKNWRRRVKLKRMTIIINHLSCWIN